MYNGKQITAVVPARKGSVRIKSKALLKLNNETLIQRKIRQLKESKYIDRIVFGSNCDEMLAVAEKAGAQVVRRPEFYCDQSKASANDMIGNMMSLIKTDVVVWAHLTNPLLSGDIYDGAIEAFFNNDCDSVLSVVKLQEHLWDTDKKTPLNYNPYGPRHVCARDLPAYYMQDGGIFIQRYEDMKKNSYFFGKRPHLFQVDKEYFLDINEYRDYLLAKELCKDS